MARTAAPLTRRRAWLPFFFLVCVAVWYRRNHPRPSSPTWAVADFQIKEYRTKDQDQANNAGSFLNRDHPSYRIEDYRQEIEEIRNRPAFQQQQLSYDELQDRVQQFIQWDRPWTDHWPAWHDYDNADYDPNRWEGLSRQYEFFVNNSVQQIEYDGSLAEPYLPYPDYNSARWKKRWNGKFVQCHGPRGETFWESDAMDSVVKGYQFNSDTFPIETVGSASALGLDQSTCFDRYSRYEPYGLADDPQSPGTVDWKRVKWGALQESCFEMNMDRYAADARLPTSLRPSRRMKQSPDPLEDDGARLRAGFHGKRYKERTAILIRTWEGYEYRENDIQAIRALVTETSLMTGGEYQVFLFVNIKQREANIYEDEAVYRELLRKTVPKELRDIAILWTERVLEEWYPNVGDWQVYWMQFMPLQWFSKLHPEFDYIWNWETDARYIGNHYHFFEQIAKFARNTPRKHMWERNSRFFFPDSWNGDYDAFLADTDEQILNASSLGLIDEPVWGPRPYAPFQYPLGPLPPHKAEEDNFEWGVGEDADLITLQPIWDPAETEWSYRNHIWNFIPEVRPHFTPENGNADGFDHPGFPTIPRRVFINTVVRFSKRMLHVMHLENLQGRAMQAEMWPATVALQHGLKAVYAPHPIWSDRKWPAWYAEAVFNADDGIPARWGQQLDSPYNHDREANFGGWSWYYRSVFPHMLFRKWLGWKAKDWGWDEDQAKQTELEQKIEIATKIGASLIDIDRFRMCLPGILLHPVKNVHEAADGG